MDLHMEIIHTMLGLLSKELNKELYEQKQN